MCGGCGIAANLVGRRFIGVEQCRDYLALSVARRREFVARRADWSSRIPDLQNHIL